MPNKVKEVRIHTEYITLGQLLKFADVILEGSEAKIYLVSEKVLVNGIEENRRGRKIYPHDEVVTPELTIIVKGQ